MIGIGEAEGRALEDWGKGAMALVLATLGRSNKSAFQVSGEVGVGRILDESERLRGLHEYVLDYLGTWN